MTENITKYDKHMENKRKLYCSERYTCILFVFNYTRQYAQRKEMKKGELNYERYTFVKMI